MSINVIGAKYPDQQVSVQEVWVPLTELPIALGALSVWGEAPDDEHARLAELIGKHPDQFRITTEAFTGRLDEPDRKTAAAWDMQNLYGAQGPVMEVSLSKIRVQGRPVHGMAARIEQGLGIEALRIGSFTPMNSLHLAVYTPEQCRQLLDGTPNLVTAGEELKLYPPRSYRLNDSGTWE